MRWNTDGEFDEEGGGDEALYNMSRAADIAWTVVFSVMIIAAIVGNLAVFWIVLAHRRMRNVTNYFLVNLSMADLMMSCLNTVFNFIFMKNRNWPFGRWYCTVNNFIAFLSVAVSVFTLMALSIDRYIAIVYPLKPRMSKVTECLLFQMFARVFLVAIWVGAALLSLPPVLFSTTYSFAVEDGDNVTVCFMHWPDGLGPESRQGYIYDILYFILTYMVPIVAMGVSYGHIGRVLWGRNNITGDAAACSEAHERKLASKRKVVKMFMVVVIIFAVCWLPYHVYFIYTYHDTEIRRQPYIQHVYLGFYWLPMSNSMFNPLIYYWMNARFRAYFRALLCSLRRVICQPNSLFRGRRSESKSSLEIGIVPTNRHVVQLEMDHYTTRTPRGHRHHTVRQPKTKNSKNKNSKNNFSDYVHVSVPIASPGSRGSRNPSMSGTSPSKSQLKNVRCSVQSFSPGQTTKNNKSAKRLSCPNGCLPCSGSDSLARNGSVYQSSHSQQQKQQQQQQKPQCEQRSPEPPKKLVRRVSPRTNTKSTIVFRSE